MNPNFIQSLLVDNRTINRKIDLNNAYQTFFTSRISNIPFFIEFLFEKFLSDQTIINILKVIENGIETSLPIKILGLAIEHSIHNLNLLRFMKLINQSTSTSLVKIIFDELVDIFQKTLEAHFSEIPLKITPEEDIYQALESCLINENESLSVIFKVDNIAELSNEEAYKLIITAQYLKMNSFVDIHDLPIYTIFTLPISGELYSMVFDGITFGIRIPNDDLIVLSQKSERFIKDKQAEKQSLKAN